MPKLVQWSLKSVRKLQKKRKKYLIYIFQLFLFYSFYRQIPERGNTASVKLTVYHRNGLGLDDFLGQIELPLSDFDVYERSKSR